MPRPPGNQPLWEPCPGSQSGLLVCFLTAGTGPGSLAPGPKPGDIVLEQKINEFFGDAESTGFGTGWWSGILSAFFGLLSLGAVLCLHFPQLLTSPELRPHYPMHTMRLLIQCLIVGAILFGVISSILRKKKILPLTGMLFAIAATALGGSSVRINGTLSNGPAIGLDWFLL